METKRTAIAYLQGNSPLGNQSNLNPHNFSDLIYIQK